MHNRKFVTSLRGDVVQQTYRRPIDAFNEVGRALGD